MARVTHQRCQGTWKESGEKLPSLGFGFILFHPVQVNNFFFFFLLRLMKEYHSNEG